MTAIIPAELLDGSARLPKADPDRERLVHYEPEPTWAAKSKTVKFTQRHSAMVGSVRPLSREIDIHRLDDVLSMPADKPYESMLSILAEVPRYPEPPPERPKDVNPPPPWTPWRLELAEPTLGPLFGTSALGLRDPSDEKSYKLEQANVDTALAHRTEILDAYEERNAVVADLAEYAAKRHAKAVELSEKVFVAATEAWRKDAQAFAAAATTERENVKKLSHLIDGNGEIGLLKRIELAMATVNWPPYLAAEGSTRFDNASGIVIHEHRFPDIAAVAWMKQAHRKTGWTKTPANQREMKEAAAKLYPSLCLRIAAEIERLDCDEIVKAIAVNGWADFTEKSTGQRKRAYCASMFATKEQMNALNLSELDPLAAFSALKGTSSRSLELIPIAPILRLEMNDPRFVDAKEIISHMSAGENLAAMDWEDFEHLCRELFEREFAGAGVKVKVTQASRDQGVDAIIFDPDPLRGGKIIIQAKRYTNTVDVSAVRDLYGTVINEGAIKGILVTTSHYGPESYSFAKGKPVTLLNGSELLSILQNHGYVFRINLEEAKSRL